MKPAPVYIEISLDSFRALQENDGLELPLERLNNGRLTASSRENLTARLKGFLKRKKWQLPVNALCALGASGVSLRRLALPPAAKEEWQRLLRLQIEAQFPLGPDELAWGCLPLGGQQRDDAPAKHELLVVAVRKDVLEDYSSVLSSCGMRPIFTLAGLARSRFCPQPDGACSILDLDRKHSEWISFKSNVPIVLRVFPWGTDHFTAMDETLDMVVQSIRSQPTGQTLFLTGGGSQPPQLATALARKLGEGVECRWIEAGPGTGLSAAVLGLKQWAEANGGTPPLTLQIKPKPAKGKFQWSDPVLRQRAVAAVLMLIVLLALPYAQAFLLTPFLSRKLAVIKSEQGRLFTIDRELNFLQYLKENQPPYLDALYLFAKAAPPGTSLDSVTMNRRGEVSLSGSLGSFQQVVEFRTRLIKSDFFSNVSVEEQVPVPNQPKVKVRIIAKWQPAAARALLAIGPSAAEIAQAKAGHRELPINAFPSPVSAPAMMPHTASLPSNPPK